MNIYDIIFIIKNVDEPIHIWYQKSLIECITFLIEYKQILNKELVQINEKEYTLQKINTRGLIRRLIRHSLSYNKYVHIENWQNHIIDFDITDLEVYVRKLKIEHLLKS